MGSIRLWTKLRGQLGVLFDNISVNWKSRIMVPILFPSRTRVTVQPGLTRRPVVFRHEKPMRARWTRRTKDVYNKSYGT
jgi:hypothetical protein